jgi:predicted pyridoxine 5'-phosphate oxidase superfamily flavin-nucleotide-binding protein
MRKMDHEISGFLKVLDDKMIGFADFIGNRHYVTLGQSAENPKALLFLVDYRTFFLLLFLTAHRRGGSKCGRQSLRRNPLI